MRKLADAVRPGPVLAAAIFFLLRVKTRLLPARFRHGPTLRTFPFAAAAVLLLDLAMVALRRR